MSIDKALCKEPGKHFDKPLTAIEAHYLALKGDLTNPKAFECITPGCNYKYTCTNFSNNKYVREPHFVPGNQSALHSSSCGIVTNIKEAIPQQENSQSTQIRTANKLRINVDQYGFNSVTHSQSKTKSQDAVIQPSESNSQSTESSTNENMEVISSVNSLRRLVTHYRNAQQNIVFKLSKYDERNMDDLFIDLTKVSVLPNDDRNYVYHGRAWVNKNDKQGNPIEYLMTRVKTEHSIKDSDVLERPSFIFTDKDAVTYSNSQVKEKLDSDINESIYFYLFGKIYINGKYINFNYHRNHKNIFFTEE